MLSEVSRSQKGKSRMVPLCEVPRVIKSMETESQVDGGCQGLGEGDGEIVFTGDRVSASFER